MKKISILSTLAIVLMFVGTGCLKDKGFENQNYGIDIKDVKGVAFPRSSASPIGYGLEVSASTQAVGGILAVTLETSGVAESDVVVTLSNTTGTALAGDVADYNTANPGANVQVLPLALYTVPLTLTIPAGQKLIEVPINVLNTTSLNPNLSYAVGFTIVSATAGYQVAANQKKLLVKFSVKNKYDGHYMLHGHHNRDPYTFDYDTEIDLITTGPSSVIFYWPDVSSNGHPIGVGVGSLSWYGSGISPVINFDPATNLVTSVINNPPNATVITMFTGAGSRLSKFNPATRAITVDWNYNGNPLRAFFDDLTYIGPR